MLILAPLQPLASGYRLHGDAERRQTPIGKALAAVTRGKKEEPSLWEAGLFLTNWRDFEGGEDRAGHQTGLRMEGIQRF
jgi:hypothetical protein